MCFFAECIPWGLGILGFSLVLGVLGMVFVFALFHPFQEELQAVLSRPCFCTQPQYYSTPPSVRRLLGEGEEGMAAAGVGRLCL